MGSVAHPASYTKVNGSFPGVKRSGRDVGHPPSSAEVKERLELYIYYPLGIRGLFHGEFYLYLYFSFGEDTISFDRAKMTLVTHIMTRHENTGII